MSQSTVPTVRDHLAAVGECPEWLLRLGEAIQSVTRCDAALAALRARDLARHPDLAHGLAQYAQGWLELVAASQSTLTPLQQETLARVLGAIHQQMMDLFQKEE
ncbi:MAG: hypothetical protein JXN59_14040 [Anaerolineae bacterium]|nr:hypothetical protein [Anaerolineae bacterium]